MAITWIVCPNLWGARLFEYDMDHPEGGTVAGIKAGMKFLREFPRPRIRTQLEDFHDDDDVADIESPVEDPALEKRVAEEFMTQVASELEKAAARGAYQAVILCAEPHLLNILQQHIGTRTRGALIGQVAQDLYEVNETDLVSYVKDLLETPDAKKRLPGSG